MADIEVKKISETSRTITIGWTPPQGQEGFIPTLDGSEKLIDGKRHPSTSETGDRVQIGKPADETNPASKHKYGVKILGAWLTGVLDTLPKPTPPPVDPPPVTQIQMTVAQATEAFRNGAKLENAKVSGGLSLNLPGLTLRNVECDSITVSPAADGLKLLTVKSYAMYWQGAQNGLIDENCYFDGRHTQDDINIWEADQDFKFKVPSVAIRRSTFKGFGVPGSAEHSQALFLGPSKGEIDRCVFDDNGTDVNGLNNSTAHVFLSEYGFAAYRRTPQGGSMNVPSVTPEWTIKGCTFGDTPAWYAINVHSGEIPFDPNVKIYVEPGQRSVKGLCSDQRWIRAIP